MALCKEIELDNGIVVKYHRIISISKITNNNTLIEVGSYINETKRQEEIDYYNLENLNKTMNVFIHTTYINKQYNEEDTIKDLYEYLKTTEIFEGAKDI